LALQLLKLFNFQPWAGFKSGFPFSKGAEILYYFLSILTFSNEKKTQNYKVVDLIENYNFQINFILIQHRIKEL
jgi:hypothetical protein